MDEQPIIGRSPKCNERIVTYDQYSYNCPHCGPVTANFSVADELIPIGTVNN